MRILVVSQYFWPENFRINDLVAELVRRGHSITVLTGQPNYPGGSVFSDFKEQPEAFSTYEGASVVRVAMLPRGTGGLRLMLNYVSFALSASIFGSWMLRGQDFDAIFVFEPSPVTVGLPAIVLKKLKRAPIAFWVLDLWPQSLEAVGVVRSKIILSIVDRLVRFIYRRCDAVLAQSRSFIRAISQQIDDPARIVYFPSWAEPATSLETVEFAPEVERREDLFNVVFTGNVGEAQDFGAVLVAADAMRHDPVRWIIVGDGRKSNWLAEEINRRGLEERFILVGRFGLERMPSFFRHADALLVSLRDEPIFAMTIPGKVQSYLMAGRPILAMLNGEGARVVNESGAGFAVNAGDPASLVNATRAMLSLDRSQLDQMRQSGRQYAEANFNRDVLISQLEDILHQLGGRKSGK
ncbi:group 1 glycosyl transferase [Agrobacterium albertimagni AOL15]|uniref:Group 1 glycosyl transferase n=1 Tax=Agrobacterium albertimagni AOL15 TaxID=1156935 RepID=K2QVW3_9HYPH|nr:glycosyltransferase family 4 protein [Agrobacterium albertimagni]EKF59387.1 group 1 glycosyl transferase [Agrobacterium albertimagni AOL15]